MTSPWHPPRPQRRAAWDAPTDAAQDPPPIEFPMVAHPAFLPHFDAPAVPVPSQPCALPPSSRPHAAAEPLSRDDAPLLPTERVKDADSSDGLEDTLRAASRSDDLSDGAATFAPTPVALCGRPVSPPRYGTYRTHAAKPPPLPVTRPPWFPAFAALLAAHAAHTASVAAKPSAPRSAHRPPTASPLNPPASPAHVPLASSPPPAGPCGTSLGFDYGEGDGGDDGDDGGYGAGGGSVAGTDTPPGEVASPRGDASMRSWAAETVDGEGSTRRCGGISTGLTNLDGEAMDGGSSADPMCPCAKRARTDDS